MYFPKYWIKAAVKGPNRKGVMMEAEAWGWSDISEEDARQRALVRAQGVLARIPMSHERSADYYENRPFKEPILQDLTQGGVQTLITRNSLGCEVLNTDGIGFADIDYIPVRVSLFAAMFDFGGKKAAEKRKAWEGETLEGLRNWQRSNASWSFRVYRTAGGLRLLQTSKLLKADARETMQWLEGVGADSLYQKLCLNQKTFRARLTPKHWRCGLGKPPMRSPWETASKEPAMQKWLEKYQRVTANYATCLFLETMGSASMIPESRSIVALHDERTAAISGMPLA